MRLSITQHCPSWYPGGGSRQVALPNSGAWSRVSSMPMEVGRLSGAMVERGDVGEGGGGAAPAEPGAASEKSCTVKAVRRPDVMPGCPGSRTQPAGCFAQHLFCRAGRDWVVLRRHMTVTDTGI